MNRTATTIPPVTGPAVLDNAGARLRSESFGMSLKTGFPPMKFRSPAQPWPFPADVAAKGPTRISD
jgi:hypothetical protein